MRYVRYVVLGSLAVVLITVALANRGPLTLRLLPEQLQGLLGLSWQVTLPAFLVILLVAAFGVLIGFVWEWIREHRYRAEAAAERRERERLQAKVRDARVEDRPGDDVLALLESR